MHIKRYLEKLDMEIDEIIRREAENPTSAGERDLHYLFENRKHVKEWAGKHYDDTRGAAPTAASYMNPKPHNPGY